MKSEIKSSIRSFIINHIQQSTLEDDQDLFGSGLLNSLFAMQLVQFVENEFNLKVQNEDLDIANFRTVSSITELVSRKTGAGILN